MEDKHGIDRLRSGNDFTNNNERWWKTIRPASVLILRVALSSFIEILYLLIITSLTKT